MFGCTKLINNIFTLVLTLLLLVSLVLSLVTYSTVEVLSDRENLRSWLKSESVRVLYADYVTEEIFEVLDGTGFEDLIDQDEASDNIGDALDNENVDLLIDDLVDDLYDFLEGETELPQDNGNNEEPVVSSRVYDDIFSTAAALFGVEELESIPSLLDLFGVDDLTSISVPDTYQKLLDLPKKLFIASGVIALVLLFSSSSGRNGFLIIGLVGATATVIILFGPQYLSTELGADILQQISGINLDTLPDINDQPEFIQELYKEAQVSIMEKTRRYAIYLGGASVVLIVLSQLGFNSQEVEMDEDDDEDSEEELQEDNEDGED